MSRAVAVQLFALAALLPSGVLAQAPKRINIYRYALDIDIPESGGLIALDAAGTHVLRGSQPKPISASAVFRSNGSDTHAVGASLDVLPYYLLGGGKRSLVSYRKMTVAGRLTRVVTKTAFSLAALTIPGTSGSLRLGLALRTTFHDPHDPISTARLPEAIDSALRAHGVPDPGLDQEHLGELDVDLRPVYAAARREVSGHGDVQVTGGWGISTLANGAVLDADSLHGVRHTFWLTAQHSFSPRFDLLVTAQLRTAPDTKAKPRFGLGIQRKAQAADYRAELYWDRANRRLNPGVSAELRAGHGVGLVGALGTDSEVGVGKMPRIIRATMLIRWYSTSEPR
jgi:hypothetical protein